MQSSPVLLLSPSRNFAGRDTDNQTRPTIYPLHRHCSSHPSSIQEMVLHNPGNWHWTTKDCRPWAKSWFTDNLCKQADNDQAEIRITTVSESSGDCDVAMRKGKIITIYDIKLVLKFTGTLKDAESTTVDGNITIPEVMHDHEEDDYVFDIEVFSETREKAKARDLIKQRLVPALRQQLQGFPQALVDAHGKDVKINFDAGHAPTVGTAANAANAPTQPQQQQSNTSATAAKSSTSTKKVNTSSIAETFEFQTLAKELYTTFIDPARLAAWTRAQPNIDARKGGQYQLFNGNVEGEFLDLQENEKLVQTWRLKDWPAGHYATLTMTFDQGLDGTNLRMVMEDVPLGTEEVVKTNFVEYYVKPIKTTFGFGAVL
ncbi:activator of Hsp90 ATPase [Protomyces lactucae-debilis]|uniref:Activator of Hsp90 ATPase n=1 Tax=Protomyces lactucae-debilis TaxID=2754530 RepID=A0A1Y2FH03_PROLT|nr:activator of Hsp90 ATPase [Protomyces lactucae-debilis]ORY83212.1 activator of Hsp90 ATPase [Protomyces lactucae-debilis]